MALEDCNDAVLVLMKAALTGKAYDGAPLSTKQRLGAADTVAPYLFCAPRQITIPLRRALVLWTDPKLAKSKIAHIKVLDFALSLQEDDFTRRNYPYSGGASFARWRKSATKDDLWKLFRKLVEGYGLNVYTVHRHFLHISEWPG